MFYNRGMRNMHSDAYLDRATAWSRSLEDRESFRNGVPLRDARQSLSRRLKIPAGTFEGLRNGRVKQITAHLFEKLRSAIVADLEAEIAHLEHEVCVARQSGLHDHDPEVSAVLAHLDQARQALGVR